MDVRQTERGIRAVDVAGSTLDIETEGWEAASPPSVRATLSARLDGPDEPAATVTGGTRALTFPGVHLHTVSLTEEDRWNVFPGTGREITLPADEYLLGADSSIRAFVRFDGPARIETAPERSAVTFPEETAVAIGFEPSIDRPDGQVVVPETPAGMAAAVSTIAETPSVTTAARSWPSLRPHPPLVSFEDSSSSGDAERASEEFGAATEQSGARTGGGSAGEPTSGDGGSPVNESAAGDTTTDRPIAVTADVPTGGGSSVVIRVPAETGHVLSVAPLAYYLGGTVETGASEPHAVCDGQRVALSGPEGFDTRTNRLLWRTFWLDCLVRSAGEYGQPVAAADRLPEIGIDADALFDAPMGQRVLRYLDAPVSRIADALPEWHLSVTLPAEPSGLQSLPRLLGDLPFVHTEDGAAPSTDDARAASVDNAATASVDDAAASVDDAAESSADGVETGGTRWRAIGSSDASLGVGGSGAGPPGSGPSGGSSAGDGLPSGGSRSVRDASPADDACAAGEDRSAADASPAAEDTAGGTVPCDGPAGGSIDDCDPRASEESASLDASPREARYHGRFADSAPSAGFDADHTALANRDVYVSGEEEPLEFLAVVNDATLSGSATEERNRALELYRRRADRLGLEVTLERNLSVAQLAQTIEDGTDVLHFVGHHDDQGLACPDGALEAASVDRSRARTFLLNACGSVAFGTRLIEKGSVAGGVTLRRVVGETAVRVGTGFAGLIGGGFAVAPAVEFASRHSIAPDDYRVVGDGTHVVSQHTGTPPAARIEPVAEGFRVERTYLPFGEPGVQSLAAFDDDPHLGGEREPVVVDRDRLHDWLSIVVVPVVFDGRLFDPDDLRDRL